MEYKDKIYTVRYTKKIILDTRVIVIFATYDEQLAKRYVAKFNRILNNAKDYWKRYKTERYYLDPTTHKHYNRIEAVHDTCEAYYIETPIR